MNFNSGGDPATELLIHCATLLALLLLFSVDVSLSREWRRWQSTPLGDRFTLVIDIPGGKTSGWFFNRTLLVGRFTSLLSSSSEEQRSTISAGITLEDIWILVDEAANFGEEATDLGDCKGDMLRMTG